MDGFEVNEIIGVCHARCFEAVGNDHPLCGQTTGGFHQPDNLHIHPGRHLVMRPRPQRGAHHLLGGVGFGGVGIMEATGIAHLSDDIGKHLAHLLNLLADFRQINQFQRAGQKLPQPLVLPSSDEELSQVKVFKIEPAIAGAQEIVKDVVGDRRFPLPTDDGVCHKVSPIRSGSDLAERHHHSTT